MLKKNDLLESISLEPIAKRREDLGKHNVDTHFPKDRNCEICKRTKITRSPCRRRHFVEVHRRYQNNIHVNGYTVGKTDWIVLGRGWRKRIVRCIDRIHNICSTKGAATGRIYMVWRETRKLKLLCPDDRWPELRKYLSDALKKIARQRWTIEKPKVGSAGQLRGRRVQVQNQSRSEKVGGSDASLDALKNTDQEQWRNSTQNLETQDKLRLLLMPTNTRDKDYKVMDINFIKITLQQKGWNLWLSTVLFTIFTMLWAWKSRCKGSSGERMCKL